jgi:hypothetical protein
MGNRSILNAFAGGLATFLSFAVEVGLLVIALTIVRSKRPEAAAPLAIGAVMHLFATVSWSFFTTFIGPAIASENMGVIYGALSLFLTLIRTAGWAAILFGIIKLASPSGPPGDPTRFG